MSAENGEVILRQNPTDLLEQARNYLQQAQHSLQETSDFDEILGIRDHGELFRQYSRQQKYGIEIQNTGVEIKIRAERRMGELLQGMTKNRGQLFRGNTMLSRDDTHAYAELAIQKIQVSRWQRSASLPESIFEVYIRETKERQEEITTNAIFNLTGNKLI